MERDWIVLPGEVISETTEGIMCGTGVFAQDGQVIATVRGFVTRIGQLLAVTPMTSIYTPNVGDIVVGRVAQVQQQRWKVQIGCSVLANLRLSSIYLPDDQLRRRTTADERNMRQYFDVGDLICAEVQQIGTDGSVFLHTRQQHPKRLDHGLVIEVPARLIKRVPMHMQKVALLDSEYQIIYGLNGTIWLSPVEPSAVLSVPRIRNCFMLLGSYAQQISTEVLCEVFEKTLDREPVDILTPETAVALGFLPDTE
jgi:exosome complex component RRP4